MQTLSVERRAKCTHLIKKYTKRPDIRLKRVWLTLNNLRRQIVRSTDDGFSLRLGVTQDTTNTEISKFDETLLGKEDVLTLKITMQNLFIVNVLDS